MKVPTRRNVSLQKVTAVRGTAGEMESRVQVRAVSFKPMQAAHQQEKRLICFLFSSQLLLGKVSYDPDSLT